MRPLNCLLIATAIFMSFGLSACTSQDAPDSGLLLRWGVLDNHLDAGFRSRLALINTGSEPLGDDWTMYFNFLRVVDPSTVTPLLAIEHVNGDLYRLTPGPDFAGVPAGDSVVVEFTAAAWAVSRTDAPAGAYMVRVDPASGGEIVTPIDIAIEPFITERQTDRGINDNLPVMTPEVAYEHNRSLRRLAAGEVGTVTPTPVLMIEEEGDVFLEAGMAIYVQEGLSSEAEILRRRLDEDLSIRDVGTVSSADEPALIRLRVKDLSSVGKPGEVYSVTVDPDDGIEIEGAGRAGVFYGIQTLLALVDPYYLGSGRAVVPAVRIQDAPRFAYRGMHLDVARNFQPKEAVLRLLDVMAFYKLNRFHFHLTDDEGWRLEIHGLPELTSVGAFRGHTTTEDKHLVPSFGSGPFPDPAVSPGSGYYTRADFIEILRFANERHIEVIPEIDVPGHARAAIVSMKARYERLMEAGEPEEAARYMLVHPEDRSVYMSVQHWTDNVIDVCMPSTYAFLDHVIADVVAMYNEAGVPLTTIHTGGDEVPAGVWTASPACDQLRGVTDGLNLPQYFLDRIDAIISEHGLITAGWEEVALHVEESGGPGAKEPDVSRLESGILPYVWNSIWGAGSEGLAYRLANAGFEIVLSSASNYYFDLAYEKHPKEPGYYWAGYVDMRKPFELEPLDLYRSGKVDFMGNPIPPSAYDDSEQLTERGRQNILGIQGQLWGENAKSVEIMEYLAYPRLVILAERAWAERPLWSTEASMEDRDRGLQESWLEFANRLGQRELPRLDRVFGGVLYRLPPPGAVVEDGVLSANVALPGLVIRYTEDGTVPDAGSPDYGGPVEVGGPVWLRSFDTRGRGSRPVQARVLQE